MTPSLSTNTARRRTAFISISESPCSEIQKHLCSFVVEVVRHFSQPRPSKSISDLRFAVVRAVEHKESAATGTHYFSTDSAVLFCQLVPTIEPGITDARRSPLFVLPVFIQEQPKLFDVSS